MNDRRAHAYVVTVKFDEQGLSDLMALNSAMINGGFKTTLNDADGHAHALGSHTFGIISASDETTLCQQASELAEAALQKKPTVKIATFEAFLRQQTTDPL
ncbi:hypothetical protein BL250_06175 [Erwinia sp. OLTSP20]|uniref:type V toxin-antitoxin system endoribonuclease antitoxin GhoS n=1 Tax=unclassified Erwinia TaxID=2622719 RepID=UPI000C1A63D3|nr:MULTISPECIES: type V toxin-antitoxin system endoribonuclease antitoxin GhoS [unclassified Erwinia]PIJ51853.1 hypothetical protein BV501_02660 [Erwinia sp. OAMSP11]PIJ74441.1 hypothetical protein BK416_04590 [Erwinia sp. OLSSP12]PIJ83726.1 hypothetical protein BLD47_03535 [Erwinia sp. OLCASP19]PIJ86769.1 hypothetical protein BLD46_02030 [Erwinia sp. OLMTSP26]PIJ88176.1 hypothetical protein BLD49_02710 [Erwinia sp. OLMDSP33]